jgi:hypothetical protein
LISIYQMIERVRDETFTQEQAAALVAMRVIDMIPLGYTSLEAAALTLANLGYATAYYSDEIAKRVMDVYGTTHPVHGRKRTEFSNPAVKGTGETN